MKAKCKEELIVVEEVLAKSCAKKVNVLESCIADSACPCSVGSVGKKAVVDLVVLIDTSGSMASKAKNISSVAEKAIKEAQKKCSTDLRVTWLGVDGTWAGTKFTTMHKDYINALSLTPAPVLFSDPHAEEGADSCADIATYFDWRENACRAVLYISDEPLNRGAEQDVNDDLATQNAISICNANTVSVFTHLAEGTGYDTNPNTMANYQDLSNQTGGKSTIGGVGTKNQYIDILKDVLCHACGGCIKIDVPDIKPCISISWGDSDCDCLETDDFEILCISVCNCYSNVAFDNFNIARMEVLDSAGHSVVCLPDGTPSVQVVPMGPVCFGTIPPCKDDEASCVSREFVLSTRGAKDGEYRVVLHGVCFDVNFSYHQETCFKLNLCKS